MKLRMKALIAIIVSIASLSVLNVITFLYINPEGAQREIESEPDSGFTPKPALGFAPGPAIGIISMLGPGLVFGIATVLFLEKAVLSRLARLSASVCSIGSSGDLSARVSMTGKDELSSLADEINGMLAKLEESQSELESINEKLRVVGSLTRHDVRNKLSIITNNVYLARQRLAEDHEASEYLKQTESAIQQIEKIFDFARIYEKLGAEELVYMDAAKTFEEAVMLFSDLHGAKVVNDCRGLTVLADSLLRQLFYNFIDNSLKHGENVSRIRVRYEESEKDQLKLVYEDDGVGIPKAEKEKIFKEGYGKGTGYGLYLIRKMCEVYGWIIRETGKQGKGAQFTITIPKINESGKENYQLH